MLEEGKFRAEGASGDGRPNVSSSEVQTMIDTCIVLQKGRDLPTKYFSFNYLLPFNPMKFESISSVSAQHLPIQYSHFIEHCVKKSSQSDNLMPSYTNYNNAHAYYHIIHIVLANDIVDCGASDITTKNEYLRSFFYVLTYHEIS